MISDLPCCLAQQTAFVGYHLTQGKPGDPRTMLDKVLKNPGSALLRAPDSAGLVPIENVRQQSKLQAQIGIFHRAKLGALTPVNDITHKWSKCQINHQNLSQAVCDSCGECFSAKLAEKRCQG